MFNKDIKAAVGIESCWCNNILFGSQGDYVFHKDDFQLAQQLLSACDFWPMSSKEGVATNCSYAWLKARGCESCIWM